MSTLPRTLATIAIVPIAVTTIATATTAQSIRITGGQSSNRSITSQSASVTTMDGYPGQIVSQQLRPFVTGVTPVVGGRSAAAPIADSRHATLARISQSAAARSNAKLARYLRRAESATEKGNVRMARANYKLAYGIADPATRAAIQQLIATNSAAPPASSRPQSPPRPTSAAPPSGPPLH